MANWRYTTYDVQERNTFEYSTLIWLLTAQNIRSGNSFHKVKSVSQKFFFRNWNWICLWWESSSQPPINTFPQYSGCRWLQMYRRFLFVISFLCFFPFKLKSGIGHVQQTWFHYYVLKSWWYCEFSHDRKDQPSESWLNMYMIQANKSTFLQNH